MNKKELVNLISEKAETTKKEATVVLDAVLETIKESLANGEDVKITGFGNFLVRERAARVGRNPQNGEEIEIPATKVPTFKAGKQLKEAVKHS